MDDCNRAQAVELIRALHNKLRELTAQLSSAERQDATAGNGQAGETPVGAAALRRDIEEAQAHIDRLQRCYLGSSSDVGALARG